MEVSPQRVSGSGEFVMARHRLIDRLRTQGVTAPRVLEAFGAVARHSFVPDALRSHAYRDTPLLIGDGQTISAPGIVAVMTQALELEGSESVLEVGTGSGYQAAILSRLAGRVVSIERVPKLAARARSALDRNALGNVVVYLGDGTQGRPADAPFDRIVVTAGGPEVPEPLIEQLAVGGVLVGPFGSRREQSLLRLRRRHDGSIQREVLGRCRFVDLIGAHGWA